MEKFKEAIKKWNNGIWRGACARLSRELKVSDVTISCWVSGKAKPGELIIPKIAKVLKVSEEEIRNAFGANDRSEFAKSIKAIPLTDVNTMQLPILADVPAGLPEWSERDVEMFVDIPRFMFPGADFIVRCIGDSLAPRLEIGDYCVIRKQEEVVANKPMLVETEDGYVMKIVKLENGEPILCSTNPKYKPIKPQKLRVVGQILGMWHRMDKEGFF